MSCKSPAIVQCPEHLFVRALQIVKQHLHVYTRSVQVVQVDYVGIVLLDFLDKLPCCLLGIEALVIKNSRLCAVYLHAKVASDTP